MSNGILTAALSLRQYATSRKHRGLPGGSLAAVQKAIAAGRLKRCLSPDGKIGDAALADREWDANTDHAQRRTLSAEADNAPGPTPRGRPRKLADPGERERALSRKADGSIDYDAIENLAEASLAEKIWKAQQAEMNYRREAAELVLASDVADRWSAIVALSRTKMLGVPAKIKARLPHLTRDDVASIDAVIREALEELAAGERQPDEEKQQVGSKVGI